MRIQVKTVISASILLLLGALSVATLAAIVTADDGGDNALQDAIAAISPQAGGIGFPLMYDVKNPGSLVSLAFNIINGAGGVGANVGIGMADPLNDTLYQVLTINGTIGFKNGTTPLLMNQESGTTTGNRMFWSHSPNFADWGIYYDDSNDEMYWQTSDTNRFMTIDFSGRVGIGTINPTSTLHVSGNARVDGNTILDGSENSGSIAALRIEAGSQAMLIDGNEIDALNSGLYLNNNSAGNVLIAPNGGRVGIGTNNPQENLHIYQDAVTTVGILLGNSLVPAGRRWLMISYHSSGGAEFWNWEDTNMWFAVGGDTMFRLNANATVASVRLANSISPLG